MNITNCWQLVLIVIPIFLSGCTGRHIVVLPQEAKGLSDSQWKITQEPSMSPVPSIKMEPMDIIDYPGIMEEKDI